MSLSFWICRKVFVLVASVLLKPLEEVSAGGTGTGIEQLVSKHLTEPSGSDETQAEELRRLLPG